LRAITSDLVNHVGGPDRVTVPQRILIERTAVDLLRLELLDAEMAAGTFSDHDGRIAHALRDSVRLALRELGLAPAAPRCDLRSMKCSAAIAIAGHLIKLYEP
jgi:hypothetical protein